MQSGLNKNQKKAVLSQNRAVLVVAGPGTGKTKTLVSRIVFLIKEKKVSPKKILAITFTNRAASEMRERLITEKISLPFVGTFHSLALFLLQIDPNIISEKEKLKFFKKREINEISKSKNNFEISELVESYNKKLKELEMVDYDDLLLMLHSFLKENKANFEHVLADEFQDTNPLQYEILKLLSSKNYFVIGDPKQAIYSFRGSSEKIFAEFEKDFENCKKIFLSKNYRSAPAIISTFGNLFADGRLKPAILEKSAEVFLLETQSEHSEAHFIVEFIKRKSGGLDLRDATDASANFSDFAILYRTHGFRKFLEKKFKESGIPFQIVGTGSIYEQEEVASLIDKLKKDTCPFGTLKEALESISDLELKNDLKSLLFSFLRKESDSVPLFLKYVDSLKEREYFDPNANAVSLLTMHSSKGLEFEYVFVCGLEEGIIPHKRSDTEEERRLLYVAMSRAKTGLFLTKVEKRRKRPTKDSIFLKNLKIKKLQDKISSARREKLKKLALKRAQQSLF